MSFLDEVLASRREALAQRKSRVPIEILHSHMEARRKQRPHNGASPAEGHVRRDFAAALRSGSPAIVAEIKRASPSAGTIAQAHPAQLARVYELGGAAAISVLTEPRWFGGRLQDLVAVRAACSLPVLRKDFIIDEYQVVESAAAGADAVLLIVAALEPDRLRALRELAETLAMDALVEIHDEREAAHALDAGATLIGINNRDLRSLKVDRTKAQRLRANLPASVTVVAESGYHKPEQLTACYAAGCNAVLVGEALMKAADPERALRNLRNVPR